MGDCNVQASELGGGIDCRPKKVVDVSAWLADGHVHLLDPSLQGDSARSVWLPYRERWADMRIGDTRHGPETVSRAIDLTFSTHPEHVRLVIRNGLHCCLSGRCMWPGCVDFCHSDHALIVAEIEGLVLYRGSSGPKFPLQWHDARRWLESLSHVEDACLLLAREADWWHSLPTECVDACHGRGRHIMQWVLDALAWLQMLVGNLAREAWVHPRISNEGSLGRVRPNLAHMIALSLAL